MRVSRTLLALVALLLITACDTASPEIVTPDNTLATPSAFGERGLGWSGSGNAVGVDSTSTQSATSEGGTGQMGSGN